MSEQPKSQFECKHAFYNEHRGRNGTDLLVAKVVEHCPNGEQIRHLVMRKNYERPFFITKPKWRNHKQKKSSELKERVKEFRCNQAVLSRQIGRALNQPMAHLPLRRVCRNPYVYGADITTPTLFKAECMKRWPAALSPSTVAVLDIETDVVEGHGNIMYISLTFKDRAILCVADWFIDGDPADFKQKLRDKAHEYLGEYITARNINLEIENHITPAECIKAIMRKAHEWSPDFITVWNINFDLPKILDTLEAAGEDILSIFNDPRVPPEYWMAEYTEGPKQKVTQEGKITPIHSADRWHSFRSMAGFYFIDSMCSYKQVRRAGGNVPSYKLDDVLNTELGIRKLDFDFANHLTKTDWHIFMQKNYKVEYGVYNLFDDISVELLDEKNQDIAMVVPGLCGFSEYSVFASNPRRIANRLHFHELDETPPRVVGTTSDQMRDDDDVYIVSMRQWIVTLPCHLLERNGLKAIAELPNTRTFIRMYVSDLDVEGAYPTGTIIANISRETTRRELTAIDTVSMAMQRNAGINLTAGVVNCAEIGAEILNLPTYTELLDRFTASFTETQ